ncbi:retrovirus-related Pol polyprotein from transposon opus [Trichonephila clavipes]|nr:retrovirus-related Pol polyprotein from transposon opus [Trichonephila clavipes]
MAFLIRSKKIDLIQLARDLDESPDPSMSKIVLRNLIISSKYYKEEEAKELLEVITAESLEKAFASEMVRDELKPKVVLKEYEPSPKICLENFRKAKRNSDETFFQFASRLTSMWLYYCNLREANDFESVNQLIVADKMFEMLDSETATHIGVLQGEEWYKPRDLGKQCDIFYASKGKSYDEPERAKWNDSEKRSFNGSWGKQPFGEKKSDIFSSRKNFDKGQVTEIKKFACFTCGSDKHFKRDCPKNKEVDNKRLNVNKVSTEGTELEDGTITTRVDLLDLVPGISVEGASTIYLKGIFGPAVKCPLVYVPIGLATGGQVNVVHQQVLCALAEVLVEDVLLPPQVLRLGGAQSEEKFTGSKLSGPEGVLCRVSIGLKHAKEGKGNYYEVDGYLFHRDKILGESIGQLLIPKCRRTEVLRLAHTSVFSSHMGPKKTLERIEYSFFWEGLRSDVKKFCESCKECQLTRSVRIKDRSSSTPVARPELPFEVGNMDLIVQLIRQA